MVTRVTIVAENDKPMALLGEDANEGVKTTWDSILKLIVLGGEDEMKITLNRREAVRLLVLLDCVIDNDQTQIAKEFSVIRFKIKEAVDKWDNQHPKRGDE